MMLEIHKFFVRIYCTGPLIKRLEPFWIWFRFRRDIRTQSSKLGHYRSVHSARGVNFIAVWPIEFCFIQFMALSHEVC